MISVTNLNKTYGGTAALKGLDFKISKGEFVLIFGPNGAGKSTVLKTLSTLLAPTDGKILIYNTDIYDKSNDIRKNIGFVSHEPFLYENLSAQENLVFFAELYGVNNPEIRANDLLKTLQLESRADELVTNYSRGMKQRVALGRALIHEPDILFLDEPFSGLDLIGSSIITDILNKLKLKGKTIIMSTHSFDDCADLADRILVLNNGEIALETNEVDREGFKNRYLELVTAD
ncbi:MAG: ABC transporter ATP-binding protein [Candidatus Dadabacteria bacterium]|nr:ABC transporter ATP-binding protein [Candidatus Dadabacteria bacterium]NIS08765.1 ABC transporter ATP-binding protein [Candidatus Dadabacteria bacterium]NIV42708.1 ATP-binding cassette domain-containing protein [Candidatus Dadabacteria bacterium]NIX15451.1 ATP-binding cassette domain-containing protein [Candidatus Dadabacteria bacterium]NIY22113.1 ATP-binding cassette domain-containing protein [Candidatus Dadabacteria bacterium]